MSAVPVRSDVVEHLRRQLLSCQVTHATQSTVSSGFAKLDRLLPQAGLPSGSVIEWISEGAGIRATTIALRCAAGFLRQPGALAVVDPKNEFYPLSLNYLEIPTSRLLLVRPNQRTTAFTSGGDCATSLSQRERSDSLWALEQLARCAGVRVVMAWVDRMSATVQRRLQLAVEKSGATIFLMRPATALRQTSWADLRFLIQSKTQESPRFDGVVMNGAFTPPPSQMTIELVRSRNSLQRHGQVLLDCDHETGALSETDELADSAASAQASTVVI